MNMPKTSPPVRPWLMGSLAATLGLGLQFGLVIAIQFNGGVPRMASGVRFFLGGTAFGQAFPFARSLNYEAVLIASILVLPCIIVCALAMLRSLATAGYALAGYVVLSSIVPIIATFCI